MAPRWGLCCSLPYLSTSLDGNDVRESVPYASLSCTAVTGKDDIVDHEHQPIAIDQLVCTIIDIISIDFYQALLSSMLRQMGAM